MYDALYDRFEPSFERGNYDAAVTGFLSDVNSSYTSAQGGQDFNIDDYFTNFGEPGADVEYNYSYHPRNTGVIGAAGMAATAVFMVLAFAMISIIDGVRYRSWLSRGRSSAAFTPMALWHGRGWMKRMERSMGASAPGGRRSSTSSTYRGTSSYRTSTGGANRPGGGDRR